MKRMLSYLALLMLGLSQTAPARLAGPATLKATNPLDALTIPLYRFQAKNGSGIYAAYPAYVKLFDNASNNWDKFGVVGHVYPNKIAGTVPLLALRHKSNVGIASFYFYTTDINEAINKQNAGWDAVQEHKGVIGYVATSAKPGTIAVYRYRQPTAQASYIYAFGEAENNTLKQNSDLKFEKLAFYVWANPVEEQPKSSDFPTGNDDDQPKNSNFPSASKVDLMMRQALYYNGKDTSKVNTASKYAMPGQAMTLKKSEAKQCVGDTCTFNLGIFIQRNSPTGTLYGYAQMLGENGFNVGNSFTFKQGQQSKDFVLPVKLKMGANKIKVTVDPYKQVAESNESNNSFEVTIVLEP